MTSFRKALILTHRYLGIVLSLLFVVWFVSGIGIMYSKGMPRLTPQLRLERMPALDLSQVKINPTEAAERAGLEGSPGRATLLTVMDRPAYRMGGKTVFADNGQVMREVGEAEAVQIASRFMSLPPEKLHYSLQTEVDQWTLEQRSELPLHKVTADDESRTELYILTDSGEIPVMTTRGSRALAWVAAIPHWFYFTELRSRGPLWQKAVLWSSGIACISALIGIILGFVQIRITRPFRWSKIPSYIPYAGWMRWHYITGFIFGIFTLTWVFSGFLSMEPFGWASGGGLSDDVSGEFTGGDLQLANYPAPDPAAWAQILPRRIIKEIDFVRIQGAEYYVVRGGEPGRTLISANPLKIKTEPFETNLLMSQVKKSYPDAPIVESAVLTEYDSYYYSQDSAAPLPVMRVKFADPDQTWLYVDPKMSQLVYGATKLDRIERWIYHGFHSLDFSFWYYNKPVWQFAVIVLSLGGIATSLIGMCLGFKRVLKALRLA